jgi:hypothetical protein
MVNAVFALITIDISLNKQKPLEKNYDVFGYTIMEVNCEIKRPSLYL